MQKLKRSMLTTSDVAGPLFMTIVLYLTLLRTLPWLEHAVVGSMTSGHGWSLFLLILSIYYLPWTHWLGHFLLTLCRSVAGDCSLLVMVAWQRTSCWRTGYPTMINTLTNFCDLRAKLEQTLSALTAKLIYTIAPTALAQCFSARSVLSNAIKTTLSTDHKWAKILFMYIVYF